MRKIPKVRIIRTKKYTKVMMTKKKRGKGKSISTSFVTKTLTRDSRTPCYWHAIVPPTSAPSFQSFRQQSLSISSLRLLAMLIRNYYYTGTWNHATRRTTALPVLPRNSLKKGTRLFGVELRLLQIWVFQYKDNCVT